MEALVAFLTEECCAEASCAKPPATEEIAS